MTPLDKILSKLAPSSVRLKDGITIYSIKDPYLHNKVLSMNFYSGVDPNYHPIGISRVLDKISDNSNSNEK